MHGYGAREIRQINDDAVDAQYEADKAAERMVKTVAVLKKRLIYWGTTPKGYTRSGIGLKATLIPSDESPLVQEVFRLRSTRLSYGEIATSLNERTLYYTDRKKLPSAWNADRVRQILANVLTYAGYIIPKGGHAFQRKIKLVGDGTSLERPTQRNHHPADR